jgi:hypothetical protein
VLHDVIRPPRLCAAPYCKWCRAVFEKVPTVSFWICCGTEVSKIERVLTELRDACILPFRLVFVTLASTKVYTSRQACARACDFLPGFTTHLGAQAKLEACAAAKATAEIDHSVIDRCSRCHHKEAHVS